MKRAISLMLTVALLVSMIPAAAAAGFEKKDVWEDTLFSDVSVDDWFYDTVKTAYELDLVKGHGNGTFAPKDNITLAETVALAARVHAIYSTGDGTFEQGAPWYQVYMDYAVEQGILAAAIENCDYVATRLQVAEILGKALPEKDLPAINTVDDGAIPDVEDNEAVYLLYRAGILNGKDALGTFYPNEAICRSEVAAFAARMVVPGLRQSITLTVEKEDDGGSTYVPSAPVWSGNHSSQGTDTPVQNTDTPSQESGAPSQSTDVPSQESGAPTDGENSADYDALDESNMLEQPFDLTYPDLFASGEVNYSGEQILIKMDHAPTGAEQAELEQAGVASLEIFMDLPSAKWYRAYVSGSVNDAMDAVRELDFVLIAEYDYTYETESIIECGPEELDDSVHGNQRYGEQWYLRACGVKEGWDHLKNPHKRPGYNEDRDHTTDDGASDEDVSLAGGGNGIVVAVIDTGVDYNHEDLKDNIWVNTGEIPDDGKDNDGNGYVDDYYGYDAVAGKGSAMDDQGHGTHVAGIIAAANNNLGTVGIAYNAEIMPVKAAMASGLLNQSNIAAAIIYAYSNGADVINMSFGGSASSIAVQEALATAYTRCVLVASAGNDGLPNEEPKVKGWDVLPAYPAALPYVIGVTSVNENGVESAFSNWDVNPFNSVEYEVAAPGEAMISTIPGDRYATWSGTSMAAPVVSAVAALLREEFRDTGIYPTKFIYGQICATGTQSAACSNPDKHGEHSLPKIVDIYNALTVLPNPEVYVEDVTVFDTVGLNDSTVNNGDGVIDAGETVAMGFALRNRWGMSEKTVVTVDTLSQAGISDPYITIHNESVDYGSVGTYSTQDAGKVMTDGVWTGWEKPIYITVSPDCPDDYIFNLNVTVTCENALDETDTNVYMSEDKFTLHVRRGVLLHGTIEEDMTLTADNYYIISDSTYIPAGVTVTVEPGTQIQFWTDDPGDAYAELPIVALNVDGTLLCNGTGDDPISIFPSEGMSQYRVEINAKNKGTVKLYHTKVVNPYGVITYAENCEFTQYYPAKSLAYRYLSGSAVKSNTCDGDIRFVLAEDCSFRQLGGEYSHSQYYLNGQFDGCLFADCFIRPRNDSAGFVDCVFYGNNNYMDGTAGGTSSVTVTLPYAIEVERTFADPTTGTAYLVVDTGTTVGDRIRVDSLSAFAEYLGGHLLYVETEAELEFLENNRAVNGGHLVGLYQDPDDGAVTWMDGSAVGDFLEYTCVGNKTVGVWNPYRHSWLVGSYEYSDLQNEHISYAIIEIPSTDVEEISLNRYEVVFDTDAAGWQIEATSSPSGSANAVLIYESQNEDVVKVNETGYVTPVGVGETEIRVYSPDRYVYNTLTVTVKEAVALKSISLGDAIRLPVGESKLLCPVFTPADTTKQYLTYTSSAPEVASVTAGGKMTVTGVGTAVITATNPETGMTAVVTVTGYIPAAAVTAEEHLVLLRVEGEETVEVLGVTVSPANATDKTLIWESSNPEILTVDAQGKLIKGGKGVATLRATLAGTDLYAEITVCLADIDPAVTVVRMERNASSGQYTYALLSDGTLWYWGGAANLPVKIMENVADFAVNHSDSITGSMLVVDTSGVLNVYKGSLGSWTLKNDPLGGTSRGNVVRVAATKNHSSFYFLTADGAVWAWGSNSDGQLGDGTTTTRSEAVQIPMETKVTALATPNEGGYVLLLDENENVWICGNGGHYMEPTVVAEKVVALHQGQSVILEFADAVRKGYYNTDGPKQGVDWTVLYNYNDYYMTEDGAVYGRGYNNYGQLGDGTTNASNVMYVRMEKITNATDIFGLHCNVYIQTADGKFYGVGRNDAHQIPNLTEGDQTVPSRIFFGLETNENTPTYTANVAEGVLADAALILDCNQAMVRGTAFGSMQMVDDDGNVIGLKRTIRLDKVTITPMSGSFTAGETYTLTMPENGLANQFGVGVSADTITFTVSAAAEEGEENSSEEPNSSEEQADDQEIVPEEAVPVIHETQINPDVTRVVKNEEYYLAQWESYKANGINPMFYGNVILNRLVDDDVTKWLRIQGDTSNTFLTRSVTGNYWGTVNETLVNKQIVDFDDFTTLLDLNPGTILTAIPETVWPVVTNAGLLDKDGNEVSSIGNETVTFFVEFNRDMDTSVALDVRFGSYYPYADYQVEGEWKNARRWEGTTTLTTIIENGYQYWSIANGCAADNAALELYKDWGRFSFEIDTSKALAMNLRGNATDTGVELDWDQDDFDTLMGYNIYRADTEDGYYQKLNSSIIPVGSEIFFDDTVEPGKVYYYNFTVVKTDLSESEPSGKLMILSKDTMSPVMYHTPVYQAYAGSNVVVSATVTDNLTLSAVKLHYRIGADGEWVSVSMTALNDKYSAVISGNNVVVGEIHYYITASDGVSTVNKGSAEDPYIITVQENPGDLTLGDVNADGRITILDALTVLRAVNGKVNLTAEQFACADLNGDESLSAAEALVILKYANGEIGSLQM